MPSTMRPARGALVDEGRPRRARRAVVEGRHRAEEVGDEGGARRHARAELLVGRVRVAQAHHHAALPKPPDALQCARTLRGQGDDAHVFVGQPGVEGSRERTRSTSARCAPLRSTARNGPSMCRPRGFAKGAAGGVVPRAASRRQTPAGRTRAGSSRWWAGSGGDSGAGQARRRAGQWRRGIVADLEAEAAVDLQVDEAGAPRRSRTPPGSAGCPPRARRAGPRRTWPSSTTTAPGTTRPSTIRRPLTANRSDITSAILPRRPAGRCHLPGRPGPRPL